MFHKRTTMAVAVLLTALSGCGGEVTRPRVTAVQFFVDASPERGSPSNPITLRARVINGGGTQVWHWQGCSGNGIFVTVLGPDGAQVALDDPHAVWPACADGLVQLEQGGTLGSGRVFTGRLYEQNSTTYPTPTYPAPSGTYTAIAHFTYTTSGSSDRPLVKIERRITFVWQS